MPPAARDPLIDAARVTSVACVVFFHAALWRVSRDGGKWVARTVELGPLGWYASWLVMVMPVFFVAGGYAHAETLERQEGGAVRFWAQRGLRFLGPTLTFVTIFATLSSAAAAAGWMEQAVFLSHNLTKLLWFLVSYLVVVLCAPAMVGLRGPMAWLVPGGLVVMATLVDVLAIQRDHLDLRYANLVFVWLACHQLGIAFRGGFLRRGRAWHSWLALLVGMGAIVGLLHVQLPGGRRWPVPALGLGARAVSNLQPPTVAMVWLALAQTGVLGLLASRDLGWLRRPRQQRFLQAGNALLMTTYLWHMPCVALAFGVGIGLAMLVPGWAGVTTSGLFTLAVTLLLMALVLPRIARLDVRLVGTLGARQHRWGVLGSLVLLAASLAAVWRHGLVLHPGQRVSTLGVCGVWTSALVLVWAADRPAPLA